MSREEWLKYRANRPASIKYTELTGLARRQGYASISDVMTRSEFEDWYYKQPKSCRICGRSEIRLCVDHCHKIGTPRSLLCYRCNTAEGMIGTVSNAEALIRYMRGF